jgi:hypothetical protein
MRPSALSSATGRYGGKSVGNLKSGVWSHRFFEFFMSSEVASMTMRI